MPALTNTRATFYILATCATPFVGAKLIIEYLAWDFRRKFPMPTCAWGGYETGDSML